MRHCLIILRQNKLSAEWIPPTVQRSETAATRLVAVREADVSGHHGHPIKGSRNLPYITALSYQWFNGALNLSPIIPRDASLSEANAWFSRQSIRPINDLISKPSHASFQKWEKLHPIPEGLASPSIMKTPLKALNTIVLWWSEEFQAPQTITIFPQFGTHVIDESDKCLLLYQYGCSI